MSTQKQDRQTLHARTVLMPEGWRQDVRVHLVDGRVAEIEYEAAAQPEDVRVDTLLPALCNLHSHSFQRAMAGMTEYRARGKESFWTWRDLMYRFLDQLTPEQIEAIAEMVFVEMLEAGYGAVGEFHYVHHQPGGRAYDDPSELSQRIFAAARTTGIGLTHLPVLYSYGGVDGSPLAGGQLRFRHDVDGYLGLVDACKAALKDMPADTGVGIAPHSLRATSPEDLAHVLAAVPTGPVHIHIAEQTQEVAEVEARLGQRPVAWLLDAMEVGPRWCLIHATHMSETETLALAKSGAVAGLCPITEANLGDGIFNGAQFLRAGGVFGLGSDSNVRISLTEELRMLEYSQRLRDRARNVLASDGGSTGAALYLGAARGGAQALGRASGEIAPGQLADLVAIDRSHPSLCGLSDGQVLDGLCFAASDEVVRDTWSAGRHMVRGGRHVARERVAQRFRATVAALQATL